MGVGAGLYMYDVVIKSSRSLSNLLMSSCHSRRLTAFVSISCSSSVKYLGVGLLLTSGSILLWFIGLCG